MESGDGKSAAVQWRSFQHNKPTPAQIKEWFDGPTLHNIGIITGPSSRLLVINLVGQDDREKAASIPTLPIPDYWVKTGTGEHWYYGWDDRFNIPTGVRFEGLEIIGSGGYVVGPASRHSSGAIYTLNVDKPNPWHNLTPLPEKIAKLLSVSNEEIGKEEIKNLTPHRATVIANVEYIERADFRGNSEEIAIARPLALVKSEIVESTGGWPCTAGGNLFAIKTPTTEWDGNSLIPPESVWWLEREQDFFAWLHSISAGVLWKDGTVYASSTDQTFRSLPTKAEFFRMLVEYPAKAYVGIETVPHYPPLPETLYLLPTLPTPDPSLPIWKEWINLFNPETEHDRVLIQAACLTPLWGGAPSTRPAFLFTSRHGRGVGKTSTAEAISSIYGGSVNPSQLAGGPKDLSNALISPEGIMKRIVIWDNLKGRQDYATVESMITAQSLQGHRLYVGHTVRPNYITWMLTANRAEATTDLAQRCIPIEIGPPQHNTDFVGKVRDFLGEHRLGLLSEMVEILGTNTSNAWTLMEGDADRWQAWTRAVLMKLPGGERTLPLIRRRRGDIDIDNEEGELIVEAIIELIYRKERIGAALSSGTFTFTTSELHNIARDSGITELNTIAFGRWLARKILDGDLQYLTSSRVRSKSGSLARGYTFSPGVEHMKTLISLNAKKET